MFAWACGAEAPSDRHRCVLLVNNTSIKQGNKIKDISEPGIVHTCQNSRREMILIFSAVASRYLITITGRGKTDSDLLGVENL